MLSEFVDIVGDGASTSRFLYCKRWRVSDCERRTYPQSKEFIGRKQIGSFATFEKYEVGKTHFLIIYF